MAKLSYTARAAMPKSTFAVPSAKSKSNPAGKGAYPIPDAAHARDALARSSGKPVAAQVRKAVAAKFPSIVQSKGGARGAKSGKSGKGT